MSSFSIAVSRIGWRCCLTDLGRQDAERSGVPAGGAADQYSASVANILVGNRRDAVLIEAIGPLALRCDQPLLVAVTGAPADVQVGGATAAQWTPVLVPAGQELTIGPGRGALKTYVALGGDLQAPRLLGSAAPDPRMNFLQQLSSGDTLELADPIALTAVPWLHNGGFRFEVRPFRPPAGDWTLRVVPAAEHDQVPGIAELLASSVYTVKPESDHVGVRLQGPVTHPEGPEIVSHGVPIGAVEIPHADDELILLGRYRTLTAGYPIVGVVARVDLDLIGQLVPGQAVRLLWIDRGDAVAQAAAQEASLAALEHAVGVAFEAAALTGARRPNQEKTHARP